MGGVKGLRMAAGTLPYSTGHSVQRRVMPCPSKAKITDLDERRRLAIKQGVVQLHVAANITIVVA